MSYAPASLLDARNYLARHTGLPWASLGIVGDASHAYGYHLGRDRLPVGDYSRAIARDRNGLTDAASALDVGSFNRLVQLTAHLVAEARGGRLPDVRELIGPHSDGRAYRWDHTAGWAAVRRALGDSHEWHLHISYYRDSQHRDKVAPFRAFFQPEEQDMALTNEDIDRIATAVAKRPNPSNDVALGTMVRRIYARSAVLSALDPAELATRVAAELTGQVGAPSAEQLTEALRAVLREGVADGEE